MARTTLLFPDDRRKATPCAPIIPGVTLTAVAGVVPAYCPLTGEWVNVNDDIDYPGAIDGEDYDVEASEA